VLKPPATPADVGAALRRDGLIADRAFSSRVSRASKLAPNDRGVKPLLQPRWLCRIAK